jgi:polyhydroxybutyrate depolymerase
MILFFHGNGENTLDAVRRYGVREEAERAGMIAVFPNGSPAPLVNGQPGCCGWNDGRPIWGDFQPPDDVSFVSQLLDLLIGKYNVDPNRVFAAGMSNGGFMTFRLACELSDRFAAIAVGSGPRDDSSCSITHPLSVLEFHGTDDPLLPYQGFVSARGVPIPAPVDVVKFWSAFDGCPSNPDTSMVTSVVEERAYAPCRNGTEVRLYTTTGGHHCWPGAGYTDCTGDVDLSLKATPLMVSFFLAHPRQD